MRLHDLARKWLVGCGSVEEVVEKLVVEQLMATMPGELWVWVAERKPGKGEEAGRLADDYVKVFSRVGIPEEILTDQGTNFTSKLLGELYRLINIKALRTSPYHPQTDGLVERFNGTLKDMLRKTAQEDGKNWDKLLPSVRIPGSATELYRLLPI